MDKDTILTGTAARRFAKSDRNALWQADIKTGQTQSTIRGLLPFTPMIGYAKLKGITS